MKNYKKIISMVVIVVLLLSVAAVFTACVDKDEIPDGGKTITIILADTDKSVVVSFEWTTEQKYLEGAMTEIAADNDTKVSFSKEDSAFGAFVTGFSYNDIAYTANAASEFVAQYTSITKIEYITPTYTAIIDGVQYNSNGFGISQMPIIDNAIYVFVIESFI